MAPRTPQQLRQALGIFASSFQDTLITFLASKQSQVDPINEASVALIAQLSENILGAGKRVRPFLTELGVRIWSRGKNVPESIVDVQVAQELFQSFALIHDDIMDSALIRRNAPTIEAINRIAFESCISDTVIRERAALNTALMAGDIAFAWASELCATYCIKTQNQAVFHQWSEMIQEVLIGQNEDSFGLSLKSIQSVSETEIYNMMDLKSGRYSIVRPLMLGATLAKASDEEKKQLFHFSKKLGIAFQLTDDLLGMFGDEHVMGKSTASDVTEGKRTLLIKRTIDRLPSSQMQIIESIVGNSEATSEQIQWVKQQVKDTGVRAEAEQEASKLVDSFLEYLSTVQTDDSEAVVILGELAYYMVERQK